MKIMIAGGLGYIGSALCELYRNEPQHEVIVLDKNFIPERVAGMPEHMKFIQADLRDTNTMLRLTQDVDVLYILAAEVEAEASIHKEQAIWEHNFEAPKALFEGLSRNTRILFPSTGNVFGGVNQNSKYMDLTELDEPQPKYPYAEAKRAMEKYLLDTDHNFTILRFGTNYGYAPGIRFNLVTNIFARRAMLGQEIQVHGSGDNYRPTACVQDCARALRFLSDHPKAEGEIFHVVRENFKIRDLAERVISLFDNGAKISYVAKEVPFSAYALNSDKIKSIGFEFQWDLERAVRHMQKVFSSIQPVPSDS